VATKTTAALLLRVWLEEGKVRCRLLGVSDASDPPATVAVAQGVDEICDAVRSWLLSTWD
jgi:hypothetical protein